MAAPPTVSIRPPLDLRAAVEDFAALNGMKPHAAYLRLIELGLGRRPNQVTVPAPDAPRRPSLGAAVSVARKREIKREMEIVIPGHSRTKLTIK